jgi:lysophospholipase L1-like esterase
MKVAGRILATMIAMVAILLIAVGADKGLNYLEKRKYEKECEELYAENHAEAEQLRTQIEELSQDEVAVETFLQEYAVADPEDEDEDVLQEFLTASPGDNGSGENASEESVSDGESISGDMLSGEDIVADVSQNAVWDNGISGNSIVDNPISDHDRSDHTISGNAFPEKSISENGISGNEISENSVSDNTISENQVSGNNASGGGISLTTVSGNILVRPTLRERRLEQSSYMETVEWNEADQAVIGQSTLDFSDKKIACLGDSITQAANLENMEDYQQYSYPAKLAEVLGAKEVVNLGIGGSSIGRYWQDAFVERYMDIPEDTDLILVMGGTNDGFCLHKENVGNFEERAPRTLIGDLDELMRGLKENYPDAEVVFITPLPNVLHDILRKERPELMSQRVIVDSMIVLAKEYEFDVIDLYDSNLLDSHDAAVISNYMPDGVHCNPDGYQILAEHIAADLIRLQDSLDEEDAENKDDWEDITDPESTEEAKSEILPDILKFRESNTAKSGDGIDTEDKEMKEEEAAEAQIQRDMKIEVGTYGQ